MIEMSPPTARGTQASLKTGATSTSAAHAKLNARHNGRVPHEANGDVGKYALTMMADCLKDHDLTAEERKEALWMFFDLLLTSID